MTAERPPSLTANWRDFLTPDELAVINGPPGRERRLVKRRAIGRAVYHNSKPKKIDYGD